MNFRYINIMLVSLMLSVTSIANAGLIKFEATSSATGNVDGPLAILTADGIDVLGGSSGVGSGRGINLAVFDIYGILQDTARFDTHGTDINTDASARLADFISKIMDGSTVLLAIHDEGTHRLSDEARSAMQSLGGSTGIIDIIGYRSSYALIGVAGAGADTRTAFEVSSTSGAGSVYISDTIAVTSPVPEPSTLAIFALGMIGLVSRRLNKKS